MNDVQSACLVLAPHLQYPTRNGGDILIDRRYKALSAYFSFVDIVGESHILRYQRGSLVSDERFGGQMYPKWLAAARTLLKQSHYLAERFVSREFLQAARSLWADPAYSVVVFSQLGVASIAAALETRFRDERRVLLVETQNNDYVWFRNLMDASHNPLLKLAASSSLKWTDRFLQRDASKFIFVHVSEQDQAGYELKHPSMRSFVSPPGTDMHLLTPDIHADNKIRLLFVGSLGVKMNLDALLHFRERFYPALLDHFGNQLDVKAMGSTPSQSVDTLCRSMGWALCANVSEEELEATYATAAFSLLPFPYTSGAKLKLLDSLSYGVPFLATSHLTHQVDNPAGLYPCLFSDSPLDWVQRVEEWRRLNDGADFRSALLTFAQQYTWEKTAEKYMKALGSISSLGWAQY